MGLCFSPRALQAELYHTTNGAASGAAAIGVVIDRICHFGGWSIHSGVVHDYIDPACPASDAAYAFFGWLLPPHLARSVSVG